MKTVWLAVYCYNVHESDCLTIAVCTSKALADKAVSLHKARELQEDGEHMPWEKWGVIEVPLDHLDCSDGNRYGDEDEDEDYIEDPVEYINLKESA